MNGQHISKRIRDEIDKSNNPQEMKKLLKEVFEAEVIKEVGYQFADVYEKLIEAYANTAIKSRE